MVKSDVQKRLNKYGYIFTLPFVIIFLIFNLWPTIYTFLLSFGDLRGLKTSYNIIGVANFAKLVSGCGCKHIYYLGAQLCSSAWTCLTFCCMAYKYEI